jgi:hypothetical protein
MKTHIKMRTARKVENKLKRMKAEEEKAMKLKAKAKAIEAKNKPAKTKAKAKAKPAKKAMKRKAKPEVKPEVKVTTFEPVPSLPIPSEPTKKRKPRRQTKHDMDVKYNVQLLSEERNIHLLNTLLSATEPQLLKLSEDVNLPLLYRRLALQIMGTESVNTYRLIEKLLERTMGKAKVTSESMVTLKPVVPIINFED